VTGDGAVSGFSLDGLAVWGNEDGSHETERSVTLGDDIGLDVSVVVLAGPDEATAGFQGLGNHVVDKTMFIPNSLLLELGLIVPDVRMDGRDQYFS